MAAGITDSDHDGIPDTAKAAGGTYAGLDLYAMGARPGQKDMFIQLDYMGSDASATTQDSARQLQEATLTKMAAAFAPHHIVVHFDAGTRFSAKVDTAHYNLDGASRERTFGKCTQMSASATESRTALENGCTSIYRYYASTSIRAAGPSSATACSLRRRTATAAADRPASRSCPATRYS
ncbi:hypothetical protein FSB65_38495 [Paraburkholderia sp. JPY418]|nr:hypothetical protein [Paraburkholderia youngii]